MELKQDSIVASESDRCGECACQGLGSGVTLFRARSHHVFESSPTHVSPRTRMGSTNELPRMGGLSARPFTKRDSANRCYARSPAAHSVPSLSGTWKARLSICNHQARCLPYAVGGRSARQMGCVSQAARLPEPLSTIDSAVKSFTQVLQSSIGCSLTLSRHLSHISPLSLVHARPPFRVSVDQKPCCMRILS